MTRLRSWGGGGALKSCFHSSRSAVLLSFGNVVRRWLIGSGIIPPVDSATLTLPLCGSSSRIWPANGPFCRALHGVVSYRFVLRDPDTFSSNLRPGGREPRQLIPWELTTSHSFENLAGDFGISSSAGPLPRLATLTSTFANTQIFRRNYEQAG